MSKIYEHKNITREKLLKDILDCQAKEAKWGSKASELRKKYALNYSEFKENEKVIVVTKEGIEKCGIIYRVYFKSGGYFLYMIRPKGKNWSDKTNRKAFYMVSPRHSEIKKIKKIQ